MRRPRTKAPPRRRALLPSLLASCCIVMVAAEWRGWAGGRRQRRAPLLGGSYGNGGDRPDKKDAEGDDKSMRAPDDDRMSQAASALGWFSGRASPAPQGVKGRHSSSSQPLPPPSSAGADSLKAEVDRLRAEVSSLKASQSIETFKLIKSHQDKYDGMKKDVDSLRLKLDKLKENAEPTSTFVGRMCSAVGWLFYGFDFVIKWSWRIFILMVIIRWWSSIRVWPGLPWQNW